MTLLSKTLRVIKRDLVKKCLEVSAETAEKIDDYIEFYEQSGKCLKRENHEQSSLKKYVDRIKGTTTFSFACESIAVVSSSLLLWVKRSMTQRMFEMINVPTTPVTSQADLYRCASRCTTGIVDQKESGKLTVKLSWEVVGNLDVTKALSDGYWARLPCFVSSVPPIFLLKIHLYPLGCPEHLWPLPTPTEHLSGKSPTVRSIV